MSGQQLVLGSLALSEYLKRKKEDIRWTYVLSDIKPSIVAKVTSCRTRVRAGQDENGHVAYRPEMCHQYDFHYPDAVGFMQELADRGSETIETICRRMSMKPSIWQGVFTLPEGYQKIIPDSDLQKLRRFAKESIDEVFSDNGRYNIGSMISFQFWHSMSPFTGRFVHVHANVVPVVYDNELDEFVKFNFWLDMSKGQENELAKAWRHRIESEYGALDGKKKKWNAYWQYKVGLKNVHHALRYSMRSPVIDCYRVIAFGHVYNPLTERIWAREMLDRPKSEKRSQWFGYLADGVKTRYLKKLYIEYEKKAIWQKKHRVRHCLKCGLEITWGRFPHLIIEVLKHNPSAEIMCYGKPEDFISGDSGVKWS
jgi:hypothetical protein